jgi:hypothetical protein
LIDANFISNGASVCRNICGLRFGSTLASAMLKSTVHARLVRRKIRGVGFTTDWRAEMTGDACVDAVARERSS